MDCDDGVARPTPHREGVDGDLGSEVSKPLPGSPSATAQPASPLAPGGVTTTTDNNSGVLQVAEEAALKTSASSSSMRPTDRRQSAADEGGMSRVVTLEEAVRLTGQGWFHTKLLLVSGCLVMSGVLETVVVGYLLPSATLELGMSDGDKGLLGAASYLGIVLSSHTWGLVADTQGRKKALLWATLLDVLASLASSLAPNFGTLLALRFCCGLFTSAPAALSFAYLGEFHTPATRSRSIIWIGAFPSLGLIALPGVAWAVLPKCWSLDLGFVAFGPWRLLLVLCALTSLASALLLWLLVPESPKFLAGRDPPRALAVLRRMYAVNKKQPEDKYPVDALLDSPGPKPVSVATIERLSGSEKGVSSSPSSLGPGRALHALRTVWQQTAPLFRPPLLAHTALVCVLQFGNLASANGLQIWLPDIFNKLAQYEAKFPDRPARICDSQGAASTAASALLRGVRAAEAADVGAIAVRCAPVSDATFKNNLVIGAVSLAMPVLCGTIVNFVGKRNLLVVCLLVSGVFGICLSFVSSSALVLALSSVSVAINAMGIGHISSIVVELFPTNVRAMAVSLHLMAGRVGSIVGNLVFGALLGTQCAAAFYAIGGALLVCTLLSCFLPAKGKYAA